MSTLISLLSIYLFILLGFIAKKIFDSDINEKSLILISIYFLQPFLTFWGLTRESINFNLVYVPSLYLVSIFITLTILVIISKYIFSDYKDRTIFMTISLIGNTGNLGIPLGIALFGEMSIAYTSIINIANIFFIYTVGVYFFAKSSYSLKESIKQIFKIPILWVAVLALIYNYSSFTISGDFERVLQMGSYSAIVLQLMIFGIYLAKTPIKSHNYRLSFSVSFVKLILLPLVGFMVILYFGLDRELAYILMLSLFVPLAVNSVNIASLYGCKPYSVSAVILVSSLLFLIFIYLDLLFLEKFL